MKRHFQKPVTGSIKSCIWDFNWAASNECNKMVIEFPGVPNENIVQNHLIIAVLNVFYYLKGR